MAQMLCSNIVPNILMAMKLMCHLKLLFPGIFYYIFVYISQSVGYYGLLNHFGQISPMHRGKSGQTLVYKTFFHKCCRPLSWQRMLTLHYMYNYCPYRGWICDFASFYQSTNFDLLKKSLVLPQLSMTFVISNQNNVSSRTYSSRSPHNVQKMVTHVRSLFI